MPEVFGFMSQDPPTPLNRAKQGFYSYLGPLAQNFWIYESRFFRPSKRGNWGFYPLFGPFAKNQVGKVAKSSSIYLQLRAPIALFLKTVYSGRGRIVG